MKKLTKLLLAFSFLVLSIVPAAFAKEKPAASTKSSKKNEKTLSEEEIKKLETRLTEIKEMDKSLLNRAEKRKLRREVKEIEKTMANGPVIYISASALIIILLLILLL